MNTFLLGIMAWSLPCRAACATARSHPTQPGCREQRYHRSMHRFHYLILPVMAWLAVLNGAAVMAQVGVVRTVEGQVSVASGKPECALRYGLDLDEGDAVRTGEKA